jgi:ferritin-like metal-binding protein YciE
MHNREPVPTITTPAPTRPTGLICGNSPKSPNGVRTGLRRRGHARLDSAIVATETRAAKDLASNIESSPLRDGSLIVNGNQVEHYEMALYGSLVAFAQQLGLQRAVGLLEETPKAEKAVDAKLPPIGQTSMNAKAARAQSAD